MYLNSVPIIRFDTVSKEFTPESYALKDVSFEIDPGDFLFITGPSGSGKTTLMRLLTKEYTPTAGEIFFHDEPISQIKMGKVHHHRRRIGVVFQDYRLVPEMNVWENIALPLYVSGKKQAEIEQRVTDLLNLVKLPDKADQFPSQLSGGEAQRISIARALAVGPELIFADEPTGNLDPETSKAIARLLRKINELGTTILIATHDVEVISEHKDIRQLMLENGKVVKDSGRSKTSVSVNKEEKTKPLPATEEKEILTKEAKEPSIEVTVTKDLPVEQPKKQSFFASLFGKKKIIEEKSYQADTSDPTKETEDEEQDKTFTAKKEKHSKERKS